MLEFITNLTKDTSPENAINILKEDHDTVKDIFDKFEKAESASQRKALALKAIMELDIHAAIEEEIFYPAVRPQLEKDLMNEANEEHHVAKLIIGELKTMNGSEDIYKAKFTVLAENIRHHIKEEENEMFPKVRALDIDLNSLGKKMLERRQVLKQTGCPPTAEEILMKSGGFREDSPAKAAGQTIAFTPKATNAKKPVPTKSGNLKSKSSPSSTKVAAAKSTTKKTTTTAKPTTKSKAPASASKDKPTAAAKPKTTATTKAKSTKASGSTKAAKPTTTKKSSTPKKPAAKKTAPKSKATSSAKTAAKSKSASKSSTTKKK